MAIKSFKQLLADAKLQDDYWVEKAKLHFSIELNRFFKQSGMAQKDLAEKINTSSAYVTKVFRGDANFTIETMVKLARAVDCELQIRIEPKQADEIWFSVLQSQTKEQEFDDAWIKYSKDKNEKISSAA
jgi:transcriptional regulator with XRE-family HTH domain